MRGVESRGTGDTVDNPAPTTGRTVAVVLRTVHLLGTQRRDTGVGMRRTGVTVLLGRRRLRESGLDVRLGEVGPRDRVRSVSWQSRVLVVLGVGVGGRSGDRGYPG